MTMKLTYLRICPSHFDRLHHHSINTKSTSLRSSRRLTQPTIPRQILRANGICAFRRPSSSDPVLSFSEFSLIFCLHGPISHEARIVDLTRICLRPQLQPFDHVRRSIRAAMGDENKEMVENGFDLHDRSTTFGRIGRVRQTISKDKLVSEVDLEVGLLPGLPIRVK